MPRAKKSKPSFDAPADTAAAPAAAPEWVYRTDAPTGAPAAAQADAPAPASPRSKGAHAIVDRHAKYSAAAGLVPLPTVDLAAIAGVQVSMLRGLAAHYGVPFSRERGQALVTALVGGLMPSLAGYQLLKVVGPLAGMLGISGFAMASTWAVGRVFIAHFEAGGSLLDVNVEQAREQVKAQVTRP